MIFNDISNFTNTKDYLNILNGSINADLIIIFLAFHGVFKSSYLKKWYKKYQLNAFLADTLILFIGIILARFFYKYLFVSFDIWKFTGLAVAIQIIHDVLFYWLFKSLPLGYNAMLDFFSMLGSKTWAACCTGNFGMVQLVSCLA